jgi:hypothetical protein
MSAFGKPRCGIALSAPGRVEPKWVSDSSAETCRSKVLRDKIFERVGKDGLWPNCDARVAGAVLP